MTFIAPSKFPSTDGKIITALRAGLIARGWGTGLTVARKVPTAKTRRMATVRNDSGPQEISRSIRRYGVNVWCDNSTAGEDPSKDAELMALDAMSVLQTIADGEPIARAYDFAGPYEIEDETPYVVGTKNLAHFYFTFTCLVRGTSN